MFRISRIELCHVECTYHVLEYASDPQLANKCDRSGRKAVFFAERRDGGHTETDVQLAEDHGVACDDTEVSIISSTARTPTYPGEESPTPRQSTRKRR